MQNNFKVNRPLLNVHRFEIRQFVRFWKLPIYSDQSNQKTNYLRNKVRKQLIPTLRIFFNPQLDTVLLNFVEIQKNEQLYFQSVLKCLLKPQKCHPPFVFDFYLSINAQPSVAPTYYFNLRIQSDLELRSCGTNLWRGYERSSSYRTPSLFTSDVLLPSVVARRYYLRSQTNQRFVDYYERSSFWRSAKPRSSSQRRTKVENSNNLACVTTSFARNGTKGSFAKPICGQMKSCCYKSVKLTVQRKDYLDYFSRNQIIYWLIINNNLIKRLNSYPNIFQKQVLKTILKTFDQVENVVKGENKVSNLLNFSEFFRYANKKHQTPTSSTSAYRTTSEARLGNQEARFGSMLRRASWFPRRASLVVVAESYLRSGKLRVDGRSSFARKLRRASSKSRPKIVVAENYLQSNKVVRKVNHRETLKDPRILCDAKLVLPLYKNFKNKKKVTTSTYFRSNSATSEARRSANQQISEKNLTQLLILKFTKKLFLIREKKFLLVILRNLINKY